MKSKKQTLIFATCTLLIAFIFACSGEQNEQQKEKTITSDVVVEPNEDTTARKKGFFDRSIAIYTNATLKAYQLVSKKGKYVSHFSLTPQGTFFLMQSKEDLFQSNGKYNPKNKFAVLDAKGNFLLPLIYEQIGNPGFIADGYMEIKQNGKFGLYNYITKQIIQPEFSVLFPSRIMEYIAIGEKNGTLYKIYSNGTLKAFKAEQSPPNYMTLLSDYRFNYGSDFFSFWNDVEGFESMNEDYVYEAGMVITPSYIAQLNNYPNLIRGIWYQNDSLDLAPKAAVKRNTDIFAFITNLYTYVGESRGYSNQEVYLNSVDQLNRVKGSKKLYLLDDYSMQNATKSALQNAQFLNDSLVEVKDYQAIQEAALPYSMYTKYTHFSISKQGDIDELGKGIFPMTSSIELARYHFKGCFARLLSEEEAKVTKEFDPDYSEVEMYAYTDHLSLNDLIYMRNEIYARHGMKFKDPIVSEQFKKFSWYRGTRQNVTDLLTPIERKNLELIKKIEKELRFKPETLIHTQYEYYFEVG